MLIYNTHNSYTSSLHTCYTCIMCVKFAQHPHILVTYNPHIYHTQIVLWPVSWHLQMTSFMPRKQGCAT